MRKKLASYNTANNPTAEPTSNPPKNFASSQCKNLANDPVSKQASDPTSNQTSDLVSAISRRKFLAGASVALGCAAGAATTFGIFGCAPSSSQNATSGASSGVATGSSTNNTSSQDGNGNTSNAPKVPAKIDKTYDTDLLIIGGGGSGLACAVQAALNKTDFILIEKNSILGGNANFVEGMFAIGSQFQKQQGISITAADITEAELSRGQHRQNGALWLDLCNRSADNINWCLEQGCQYSGIIDNYYGGLFPTFHWFKDNKSKVGYVEPMIKRVEELGTAIHFSTAADSLILNNGKVAGAYATGPDGVTQYNAKAVVLAAGGFGGSSDMIAKQGWDTDDIFIVGSPNAAGDGYRMATEAGALDMLADAAQSILYAIPAFPPIDFANDAGNPINGYFGIAAGGPVLWVNEMADRFTRENLTDDNLVLQCIPGKSNKHNYCIFDDNILKSKFATTPEAMKLFEDSLKSNNGNSLYAANTIEDLAKCFKHDAKDLEATINRYNELCNKGVDEDFGKPAELMLPINGEPYYIAKLSYSFFFSVGGLATNRKREVLNTNKEPIAGLYAIGNDGNVNYRNVYTINMPGTAFGNQVNSGREAAQSVLEYLKG
ncbi:MAG: FAD-dependent oxidoreductase [Coriobacteriales bacterium]|nr:FAD-dependent oxidoreductase [Coriobacteriales bacterium]